MRAALDSVEGLTEEQKAAVLGQIGSISVSVGTPNVQVEVTPEYMPDNSVMIGQLAAAKQGLSQIQENLRKHRLIHQILQNWKMVQMRQQREPA